MPLETFIGEAAVVNLSNLAPQPVQAREAYPGVEGWNINLDDMSASFGELWPKEPALRDQGNSARTPRKHRKRRHCFDDSSFTGLEQPWLSKSTCDWLVSDRKIKMLGLSGTGILWQYHLNTQPRITHPSDEHCWAQTCPSLIRWSISISCPAIAFSTWDYPAHGQG